MLDFSGSAEGRAVDILGVGSRGYLLTSYLRMSERLLFNFDLFDARGYFFTSTSSINIKSVDLVRMRSSASAAVRKVRPQAAGARPGRDMISAFYPPLRSRERRI